MLKKQIYLLLIVFLLKINLKKPIILVVKQLNCIFVVINAILPTFKMKKVYLFLALIVCFLSKAQTVAYKVVIKDSETLQPIENATFVILKTKQNFISNTNGEVSFELNGVSSVQISATNYDNETLRWTVLKQTEFVVYLSKINSRLPEIILMKGPPNKLVQKLVVSSTKQLSLPARLKVYVREFFKLNNQHAYFNDGLINFQLSNDQKKLKTTLLVDQNRSYGLIEKDISEDLLGYNLNNIMENYYSFSYLQPIMDITMSKHFTYLLKTHPTNQDYYILTAKPVENQKNADDYEITYDFENKIIIDIKITISNNNEEDLGQKTKFGSKKIKKSEISLHYSFDNDTYYLLSSTEIIGFELTTKEKTSQIEVRNSFITNEFSEKSFTFNESQVFIEKSLFNKKNKILTPYWDFSGYNTTDEELKIIQELNEKF